MSKPSATTEAVSFKTGTSSLVMSEQEENELILAWLGWVKHPDPDLHGWWKAPGHTAFMSPVHKDFPTFTDWQGRGLIIEALQKAWPMSKPALNDIAEIIRIRAGDESTIRSIALSYLRARE